MYKIYLCFITDVRRPFRSVVIFNYIIFISSRKNDRECGYVPRQFGDSRFESGFAIRILSFAVDAAYQVPVAFWFFRHKLVDSPHSEHRVNDLVVQQFRQFLFDFLGSQMLQAQSFALT